MNGLPLNPGHVTHNLGEMIGGWLLWEMHLNVPVSGAEESIDSRISPMLAHRCAKYYEVSPALGRSCADEQYFYHFPDLLNKLCPTGDQWSMYQRRCKDHASP